MSAHQILEQAGREMQDRAKVYDKPAGERSMPATVEAFNAITGHRLTAEQGWLFMVLLKAVRSQQGEHKRDNYVDLAAYASLMGEQAANPSFADQRLNKVREMKSTLVKPWTAPDYCDSETYGKPEWPTVPMPEDLGWKAPDFGPCDHPSWHYYQSTHTKTCQKCGYEEPWHGG